MVDMSSRHPAGPGPDLRIGIAEDQFGENGMILGHVGSEPVLLIRRGAVYHAIGAVCTHYSGPLAEGLVVGDTIRCPLHHACFDLRTGEAIRAPALAPVPCYQVERHLDLVRVTGRVAPSPRSGVRGPSSRRGPSRIVIVGAGAAGAAAAITLRQEGYAGQLVLIGEEQALPYDRPNLSKDYLAGTAPEDWLPLQPQERYDKLGIRLVLGAAATRVDPATRTVALEDGREFGFDALLLATGATAARPSIPGHASPHVHYLRNLADCQAIKARAAEAPTAVIVGAGFLGLEVAAALRTYGVRVQVVAPTQRPLENVFGPELGKRLQRLHEEHGVAFHLGHSAVRIDDRTVWLEDGSALSAALVVVAVGARPNTALAARCGVVLNRGILVDRYLETSLAGVYAAGDAARWPDLRTGELTRFEHWVVAQRQGQVAARNMLGRLEPFDAIPFFWSQHYDVRVNYSGHAPAWDRIDIVGGLPPDQWEQRYVRNDRVVAVATIGRDHASLEAELALERHQAASRVPVPNSRRSVPGLGAGR
jgi:NADPH-dependent 2,4-dienoyl-CoA reductase/sulfur reductase-like enzyme/nitrite reductase/ring-hydroxylating ferredoxin subunit